MLWKLGTWLELGVRPLLSGAGDMKASAMGEGPARGRG